MKFVLSPFHPGEGKEVLNQTSQALVLLGDELKVLASFLFIQVFGVQQGFHQHAHRGEWRFEFVRYGRGQIVLQSRQCHLPPHQAHRNHGEDSHPGDDEDCRPQIKHCLPSGCRVKELPIRQGQRQAPAGHLLARRQRDEGIESIHVGRRQRDLHIGCSIVRSQRGFRRGQYLVQSKEGQHSMVGRRELP